MSKLQRYNQKLLAIIGTVLLLFALFGVIAGIVVVIIEAFDKPSTPDGIQVNINDSSHNRPADLIRHQISFKEPIQLDTAEAIYLSPVGQVKISEDEKSRNSSFWGSGSSYESGKYKFNSYYGFYNNFVLNDFSKNTSHQIFKEKVVISHWAHVKIKEEDILLFRGVSSDQNNDHLLNDEDYQSLYVYDINKDGLQKFHFDNQTVLSFEPLKKTDFVMVKVGEDINGDKVYFSNSEPQKTLILNVHTKKLEELIPDTMKESIQKLIEQ